MKPNSRKPKYQNKVAYELKYQPELRELQDTAPRNNLCQRCFDIINWKLKYGKYKKPSQPGKCQTCTKKAIFKAYRHICDSCSTEKNVCSKCMAPCEFVAFISKAQVKANTDKKVADMEKTLDTFRECTRRRIMRLIADNAIDFVDGKFVYKETSAPVENIKIKRKFVEGEEGEDDGLDDEGLDDLSDNSGSYKNSE